MRFLPPVLIASALLALPALSWAEVDFNKEIRPILNDVCIACHGGVKRAGGLSLQFREEALKEGESGAHGIVPGKPEESEAFLRLITEEKSERMPKKAPRLQPQQIARMKQWIAEGAKWADHWAYTPLQKPRVPELAGLQPIDAFVRTRLATEQLSPAPAASRAALLRRVSLDLTGLPPTLEEVATFESDPTAGAFERQVDRLLTSPHFGERWASLWMDLARYADTKGYEKDSTRAMWPYRDWLIQAFNSDLPFDQFTIKQLAGDLLPDATEADRIATALHRLTSTNDEGGTDDEEFRTAAVLDRVNTTWEAWMGTSIGCAQCHDHPYDPFRQKEFYQAVAYFNNTADADRDDETPTLELYRDPAERAKYEGAKAEVMRRQSERDVLKKETAANPGTLETAEAALKTATKQRDDLRKAITQLPVMVELGGAQVRKSHVFIRGNWMSKGEEVQPGTPGSLPPLSTDALRDRLGLAQWMVARENPLTARVAVNRFWEQLFGVGLVETAEDFGTKGEVPTHPELLDWLAASFRDELGWSMKRLLREMVLSETYRQENRATPELVERDPRNRLLARGPRVRLTAEMVRDNALAVAGLLSSEMGGPSVMPYLPEGVLPPSPYSGAVWKTSPGEGAHRRALYTFWKRSNPYPSLVLFDSAERTLCTSRRLRTNTPLQALVTMNDPVYVEAAKALAQRMRQEGGEDVNAQLAHGWKLATLMSPPPAALEKLRGLHAESLAHFQADAAAAGKLAGTPEHAALTNVATVLLNLDQVLTK